MLLKEIEKLLKKMKSIGDDILKIKIQGVDSMTDLLTKIGELFLELIIFLIMNIKIINKIEYNTHLFIILYSKKIFKYH